MSVNGYKMMWFVSLHSFIIVFTYMMKISGERLHPRLMPLLRSFKIL
jgi:hypothetical protein